MNHQRQSGFVVRSIGLAFLMGTALLCPAQKDLDQIISEFSNRNNLNIARDLSLIRDLHVSDSIQINDLLAFKQLLSNYNLCLQVVDSSHHLLLNCSNYSWSFEGKVMDKASRESIPFALLHHIESNRKFLTDQSGSFNLSEVHGNSATLIIRSLGFDSDTAHIFNYATKVDLSLNPSTYELDEVEVMALMNSVNVHGHHSHLNIEDNLLNSLPSIVGPDPMNALRMLPGVGGNPESGSGLVFRGSKYDQTMVRYGSIPLLHNNHFFGLISSINPKSIQDLRVYRSGFSAKYGGYAGGLIQMTPSEGNSEKVMGGLEAGRFMIGGHIAIPSKKGNWTNMITFRKDNTWVDYLTGQNLWNDQMSGELLIPQIATVIPEAKEGVIENAFYLFHDLSWQSTYRFRNGNLLSLSVISGNDRISNDISIERNTGGSLDLRFFSFWENTGLSIEHRHNIGGARGHLSFSTSTYINSTDLRAFIEILGNDTLRNEPTKLQNNAFFQGNARYDVALNTSSLDLNVGVEIPVLSSSLEIGNTNSFTQDLIIPTLYLEGSKRHASWEWVVGSRLGMYQEQIQWEPRLSVRYLPNEEWAFRWNTGRYLQYAQQHFPTLYEGLVPEYWWVPEEEFSQVIDAKTLSFGMTVDQNDWLIDTELYAKTIKGITEQFPTISNILDQETEGLRASLLPTATGESNIFGWDLLITKKFNRQTFWSAFDATWVRNEIKGNAIRYQPGYANTFNLKSGWLAYFGNLEIGFSGIGQLDRRFHDPQEETNLASIALGNSNLPPYLRLDASLNWRFQLGNNQIALRNSFFNLLDRKNQRSVIFEPSSDGSRAFNSYNLGFVYNLRLQILL